VLTIVVTGRASAHRLDEYLQAARVAIDSDRVEVGLDLTPGVEVAEVILADIDRDRDDVLSPAEQRAYAVTVMNELALEIDGAPLRMALTASSFPSIDAVRRGEGAIHLSTVAMLPVLSSGAHHLSFRNAHHPQGSVYLANALVPSTGLVTVTAQRRDPNQAQLTIDYSLRSSLVRWLAIWLLVATGTAIVTVLLMRLLRPASLRSSSPITAFE
jgi:hypothetical protein